MHSGGEVIDLTIHDWLALQLNLQREAYKRDPSTLAGDELADYVTWNAFALEDELHELMQEVVWKPWAKGRGIHNPEAILREFVDVMHFLGNIALAFRLEPTAIAAEYARKVQVNLQRQQDGYDGVTGKCPNCHRDLKDAGVDEFKVVLEGATIAVRQCRACGFQLERRAA